MGGVSSCASTAGCCLIESSTGDQPTIYAVQAQIRPWERRGAVMI